MSLLMRMVLVRMMLIGMVKATTKLGQTDGRMAHRTGTAATDLRSHVQRRSQLQLLMIVVMLLLMMMMLVLLLLRVHLLMRLLMMLQLLLLPLQLRRDLALLAGKRLYRICLLLRVVHERKLLFYKIFVFFSVKII